MPRDGRPRTRSLRDPVFAALPAMNVGTLYRSLSRPPNGPTYHSFSGECRAKRGARPLQAAVGRRLGVPERQRTAGRLSWQPARSRRSTSIEASQGLI